MSQQESQMLLGYLTHWLASPRFTVRYHWSKGTIAMWDNRCTQHYVINDFDEERIIQRATNPKRPRPRAGSLSPQHQGRRNQPSRPSVEQVPEAPQTNLLATFAYPHRFELRYLARECGNWFAADPALWQRAQLEYSLPHAGPGRCVCRALPRIPAILLGDGAIERRAHSADADPGTAHRPLCGPAGLAYAGCARLHGKDCSYNPCHAVVPHRARAAAGSQGVHATDRAGANGNVRYDVHGVTNVAGAGMRRSDPAEDPLARRHYARHLRTPRFHRPLRFVRIEVWQGQRARGGAGQRRRRRAGSSCRR